MSSHYLRHCTCADCTRQRRRVALRFWIRFLAVAAAIVVVCLLV